MSFTGLNLLNPVLSNSMGPRSPSKKSPVKSGSPGKSPGKSPVKSASKVIKKASHTKYASKLVSPIIDNVITRHMSDVKKNGHIIEKWCHKMKLSLLRKISESSKVAFLNEGMYIFL